MTAIDPLAERFQRALRELVEAAADLPAPAPGSDSTSVRAGSFLRFTEAHQPRGGGLHDHDDRGRFTRLDRPRLSATLSQGAHHQLLQLARDTGWHRSRLLEVCLALAAVLPGVLQQLLHHLQDAHPDTLYLEAAHLLRHDLLGTTARRRS
jgi:hypothetical protein